jgi:iron transport multicopper oxidase
LNYNVTGWLVYDKKADKPSPTELSSFDPYDDFSLVPLDGEKILGAPNYTVTLDLTMDNLGDGAN